MIGVLFIVAGYAALIWQAGWIGVAALAIHVGLMLLALGK
jgi:hypothetical protein